MLTTLVTLLIFLTPTLQAGDTLRKYAVLNFPGDSSSFISLLPDTAPFRDVFSFCGWFIREPGSAGWPILLSYGGNEIRIQADGGHNCIFGSCISLNSKFTAPERRWFHYCATWSSASREFREYLNGAIIASRATTPGRQLQTGLRLILGNWGEGGLEGLQFEGFMFNVNLYAREFSKSEVEKMAESPCDLNEEFDVGAPILSWERILNEPTNGTVREVSNEPCLEAGEVRHRLEEARNSVVQSKEKLMEVDAVKLDRIISPLFSESKRLLDSDDATLTTSELIELTLSLNKLKRRQEKVAAVLDGAVKDMEE